MNCWLILLIIILVTMLIFLGLYFGKRSVDYYTNNGCCPPCPHVTAKIKELRTKCLDVFKQISCCCDGKMCSSENPSCDVKDKGEGQILNNLLCSINYKDIENITICEGKQSCSIDKKAIQLCMRDKNGKLFDDNTLMYVLLHEYAHCICKKCDNHDDNFHKALKRFEAVAANTKIKDETGNYIKDKEGYATVYNFSVPPNTYYCTE
jgi:hypothetical protein